MYDDQRGPAYHQLHRLGRPGWWRPAIGAPLALALCFAIVPGLLQVPLALWFLARGQPALEGVERTLDFTDPTPLGLAMLNITLAAAIPVTFAINRLFHGLRPGWLTSVLPRMRWRWFAVCLGLSVVALVATVVVSAVVPQPAEGADVTGTLNEFTPAIRDFALVVVLLTPFQAAGEEYLFRGYLTQAVGRLAAGVLGKALAVLAPALLFALAHGLGQSWPIFVDRFAFGVVAGVLVIATGGLEAAIAMHVLNNFLAFGLALAFSDMASALNPTGGSWWSLPGTLTQSLVYLAIATWAARSTGLATRAPLPPSVSAPPPVFEPPTGRV